MLKIQHLVSVAKQGVHHPYSDSAGLQQPSRIAYIEFFVKPEEDEGPINDSQEPNIAVMAAVMTYALPKGFFCMLSFPENLSLTT